MFGLAHIALFCALAVRANAHTTDGRKDNGLIGFGTEMYNPTCAYACRSTVTAWALDCPGEESHHGGGSHSMHDMPSPQCYATNDPFLQTLALCISKHCEGVPASLLEKYWELNVPGRNRIQPLPKYSYQDALRLIEKPVAAIVDSEEVLATPSLVDEEIYQSNFGTQLNFEQQENRHSLYGIVAVAAAVALPVFLSLLQFLPLPSSSVSKSYATAIDAPLFRTYHAVPVLGLGFIPTCGQALFIAYIWIINLIGCAVGYEVVMPSTWFSTRESQLVAFISNRTGVLALANLVVVVLFSSRNNLLLYITTWKHSTYLLVHRWIAFICTLQACIHSALYVQFYLWEGGAAHHAAESKQLYWIWGIVATLSLTILLPLSILPIRKRFYELFLASHIAFSIFAIVGSLLHIYYRFGWQWGYEVWIWIVIGVWGFDRALARPLRLVRNGVRKAHIRSLGESGEYIRIDIPGVEVTGHAYLYFPGLTWKVWENHPFSVGAVATLSDGENAAETKAVSDSDSDAASPPSLPSSSSSSTRGSVFYVRVMSGQTADIAKHVGKSLTVLIEGSYGHSSILSAHRLGEQTLDYPNLILVAGGVGITAVLPLLDQARRVMPLGRTKVLWGVRIEGRGLVKDVQRLLGVRAKETHLESEKEEGTTKTTRWGGADVLISVGERLDIPVLLQAEVGSMRAGTTVVVCGPAEMADEVRSSVRHLVRSGSNVRFVEESFAW